MIYLFALVEPGIYLVLTKCVMAKDIKNWQDKQKCPADQRATMLDDLKQGLLPTGFELSYTEMVNETLALLSFNKVLEKAFSRLNVPKNALSSHSK